MPRALLLENIDQVAADVLRSDGYEVESLRGALDEADLCDALEGVDVLGSMVIAVLVLAVVVRPWQLEDQPDDVVVAGAH